MEQIAQCPYCDQHTLAIWSAPDGKSGFCPKCGLQFGPLTDPQSVLGYMLAGTCCRIQELAEEAREELEPRARRIALLANLARERDPDGGWVRADDVERARADLDGATAALAAMSEALDGLD